LFREQLSRCKRFPQQLVRGAEKGTIEFSRAEVGEGKPASILNIGTMPGLITPKEAAYVVRSFADRDNSHAMVIKIDNELFANEILVTEVGVYAKKAGTDTEILYGYTYAQLGYAPMPAGEDGRRTWNLVFNTKISRSTNVTIVYDGSGVCFTFEEYEQAIANYYNKTEVDALLSNKANITVKWYDLPLQDKFLSLSGYPIQFCKMGSMVTIRGAVYNELGEIPLNTVFSTLPEGFRPPQPHLSLQVLSSIYGGGYARLVVQTSGNIHYDYTNNQQALNTNAGVRCSFVI